MTTWTKQDSTAARAQGWDVYEIWDDRITLEIQKYDASSIFASDEAARECVKKRAAHVAQNDLAFSHHPDNALCCKAWALVFRSKVAPPTKRKK